MPILMKVKERLPTGVSSCLVLVLCCDCLVLSVVVCCVYLVLWWLVVSCLVVVVSCGCLVLWLSYLVAVLCQRSSLGYLTRT